MAKRGSQIPRITTAARSRQEEIRRREVRYVVMMSFRAICLVILTVLVYAHAPLLVVWIPILVAAVLFVPWLAVILANDRAPKERYRHIHRPPAASQASLAGPREPAEGPKTIDIDVDGYRSEESPIHEPGDDDR